MNQIQEKKPLFLKTLLIAAFILLANFGFFAYNYRNNFSGFAISNGIEKTYSQISMTSKILFAVQWAFILLVLVFVLVRDVRVKSKGKEVSYIKANKVSGKSATDLDTLYSILQERGKLKLSTIAKAFNVDKDIAMEWCRILEAGNLASIDYPGVGEPVIKPV